VSACPDPIVEAVRTRLLARSLIGLEKYGTTLMREDLSRADWLRLFQEELLDAALYVERLRWEEERKGNPVQRNAVLAEVLALLREKERQYVAEMETAWKNEKRELHTRLVERSIAVDDIARKIQFMMGEERDAR
jgi:hypothetical protein